MKQTEYLKVFDPRGRVDADRIMPAPRVAALDGLRLGILDNTKWNASRPLRKTPDRLGDDYSFASVNYYRKEKFSKHSDPALLSSIAAENNIVLTPIGDWRS